MFAFAMRAEDKTAIGDAAGVKIKSFKAVGGGDDSEVSSYILGSSPSARPDLSLLRRLKNTPLSTKFNFARPLHHTLTCRADRYAPV